MTGRGRSAKSVSVVHPSTGYGSNHFSPPYFQITPTFATPLLSSCFSCDSHKRAHSLSGSKPLPMLFSPQLASSEKRQNPPRCVTQRNGLKCHPKPQGISQPCTTDTGLGLPASVKTDVFKIQHPETPFTSSCGPSHFSCFVVAVLGHLG